MTSTYPAWAVSQYTRNALDALPAQADETTPPPVIDEAICRLSLEARRLSNEIGNTVDALHIAFGERKSHTTGNSRGQWPTSTGEITDRARAADPSTPNADPYAQMHYPTIGDILTAMDGYAAQISEIGDVIGPLAELYRVHQWSRVYLVANDNGHVHRHTHCRTCYDTTEFHWITDLSGATDAEVIELSGERTCLVCFPEVRAEILVGRPCRIETPAQRAAREERDAKAAAKAAEAAVKGITTPDGAPLVIVEEIGGHRTLKTLIAAQRAAMDAAYNMRWYGPTHPSTKKWETQVETILPAIAHKRGTTLDAERDALIKKVEIKYRRETR